MNGQAISVVVTGTVGDALNTNAVLRDYVARGFRALGATVSLLACGAAPDAVARADLVLATGSVAVDSSNLYALRRFADRAGAVLAFWVHDDPYEFDYAFRLRGLADRVFTTDRWSAAHYPEPAVHLPLAGCPAAHFRAVDRAQSRDLDLFFCGHAYDNRIAFFREAADLLRRYATYVCGTGWPGDLPFARNARMEPALFADTAARALFTLNVGRDLSIANARLNLAPSTPGPRTFETALMGSAQLFVAEGLEVLDYFRGGEEIILIDRPADLERAIERALDEPAWVLDVAARAQARALAEHCYVHRAEAILRATLRRDEAAAPAGAPVPRRAAA